MQQRKNIKDGLPLGFLIYMLLISLWLALIAAAPLLDMQRSEFAGAIYAAFGSPLVCHQLNSRSLCYFPATNSISDCTSDSSKLEFAKSDEVILGSSIGYKLPVCARDIGIYGAMFIGGIAVFLAGKSNSTVFPSAWLLAIALIPMAIDGGTQMLGMRESSNFLRLVTGSLAGFALPFFFVPMFNSMLKSLKFSVK